MTIVVNKTMCFIRVFEYTYHLEAKAKAQAKAKTDGCLRQRSESNGVVGFEPNGVVGF